MKDLFYVFAILACFLIVSYIDDENVKNERARYCEMVRMNKYDEYRGLSEANRRGWPDYKETYYQECFP